MYCTPYHLNPTLEYWAKRERAAVAVAQTRLDAFLNAVDAGVKGRALWRLEERARVALLIVQTRDRRALDGGVDALPGPDA